MPKPPTPIDGPQKQKFIEWLLTPKLERVPATMEELSKILRVERRTLTNWKTKDKEFMEEWERQYLNSIGNPERKQKIMDTLYETATDPDDPKHVQAAKQYFEIEGSLKPQKHQVEISKSPINLSDDELDEILAAHIGKAG
jgi:hypothetical protein